MPSAASRSLTASPMPEPPPVTIATRGAAGAEASLMDRRVLGRVAVSPRAVTGVVRSRRQDCHLSSLLVPGTGTIVKIY